MKARERDALKIARINRAAAVGRLMAGQLTSIGWQDFLTDTEPDDLSVLPRRKLRGAIVDVRGRLEGSIEKFCRENFDEMTIERLADLYTEVRKTIPTGLRMPLSQFEARFGRVKPRTLLDTPPYATVSITLWGLQFEYPEHHFMEDIVVALKAAVAARAASKTLTTRAVELRDQLKEALRCEKANCRAGLIACFSLVETYLNGLAWTLVHTHAQQLSLLSANQKKLIEDASGTTFRDKLIKYPELLTGRPLWNEKDTDVETLLALHKPFRDSLCHPSPFDAPAKFGGYDKLARVYGATLDVFASCVMITLTLLERLHSHVNNAKEAPYWMSLRVDIGEGSESVAVAAKALAQRIPLPIR